MVANLTAAKEQLSHLKDLLSQLTVIVLSILNCTYLG
jgi:hypothetical protein